MKNIVYSFLAFIASFAVIHFLKLGGHGFALAAMIPMLPRNIFGKPTIQRAIQLNDGTWGEGGEILHYPIYDRLRLLNTNGTQAQSLFKTAVGQQRNGQVLTFADTNIEKSESVPSSQKWTIWRVTCFWLSPVLLTDALMQNVLDFMRTTTLRLNINSKDDMFRLPLWKFFGALQAVKQPALTEQSTSLVPIFSGSWELNVPVVLQSLTDWQIIVEPLTASAAGLDNSFVGFELDGQRVRKN